MKKGVLSNLARSHISSDRVRSGYEISFPFVVCLRMAEENDIIAQVTKIARKNLKYLASLVLKQILGSEPGFKVHLTSNLLRLQMLNICHISYHIIYFTFVSLDFTFLKCASSGM